jgi:hypothetical protein
VVGRERRSVLDVLDIDVKNEAFFSASRKLCVQSVRVCVPVVLDGLIGSSCIHGM